MTTRPDLEAIVHDALEQEAQAMTIDTSSGADRLHRELHTQRRSRTTTVALAVAAVLAVLALWLWSPWTGTTPPAAGPPPTPRPSAASIPSDWPYKLDVATGAKTAVPKALLPDGYQFGTTLAFSPDGTQVAVGTCRLRPPGCYGDSSLVISSGTAERTSVPISTDGAVPASTWAPDGRRIVYQVSVNPNGIGELFTYDVAARSTKQITGIPLDRATWWSLVWSITADGEVLYDLPRGSMSSTGWDVWQVPIDGGASVLRLRNARAPEALPDGRIAYVVPREGTWAGSALAIVDQNGSRRTLATAENGISWVRSSPDGTRLAYVDGDSTWVIDLDTGAQRVVVEGTATQWLDNGTLLILP